MILIQTSGKFFGARRLALTPGVYFAFETDPSGYLSTNAVPGNVSAKTSVGQLTVTLVDASSTNNQFLDSIGYTVSGTLYSVRWVSASKVRMDSISSPKNSTR